MGNATAAWFGESSGLFARHSGGDREGDGALRASEKNERLQNIGKINDPKASVRTRTGLGIELLICTLLMIYSLLSSQNQTLPVSGEQLVVESSCCSWWLEESSPGCAGAFWRRLPVRGPLSVCWEPWGNSRNPLDLQQFWYRSGKTITLEKFIAAVAFFGTYPAIPSSAVIELVRSRWICQRFATSLRITSSAIMLLLIIMLLARDIYYALQEGDQNSPDRR